MKNKQYTEEGYIEHLENIIEYLENKIIWLKDEIEDKEDYINVLDGIISKQEKEMIREHNIIEKAIKCIEEDYEKYYGDDLLDEYQEIVDILRGKR